MVNKKHSIHDFISNELRDYAIYDNERNIPNIADGLKISQRKVIFAAHDINKMKRVDMFGMKAAEMGHYNHAADSIIRTVVTLAQEFPGANNMPLLQGSGQFGTRLDNEPSSERYIYAMLSSNFNQLFDKEDQKFLTYNFAEGDQIEPKYYMPKLPILLINGSEGVGNGFSAKILPYNPVDIKRAVQEVLDTGLVQSKLIPHLNGWKGITQKNTENQVSYEGTYQVVNKTTIKITELPPKHKLKGYKALLLDLMKQKVITSFKNKSRESGWEFIITAPKETVSLPPAKIKSMFDLVQRTTEVLTCWDVDGRLRVFKTVEEILERWVQVRLDHYEMRRLNIIEEFDKDIVWLKLKSNFISWWNENSRFLKDCKKEDLQYQISTDVGADSDQVNRLLSLRISSLTLDEVASLQQEIDKTIAQRQKYQQMNAKTMMKEELADLS